MSDEIEIIKELRLATGLSFKEIKNALDQTGGDKTRAVEILKTQGATIAAKKASRTTQEGIVDAYVHSNKKIAAVIQLFCETDFVAKNPLFVELAHELTMHITAMNPESREELLEQPFIKDQAITVQALINQYIAKLGENIKLGDFCRYQI